MHVTFIHIGQLRSPFAEGVDDYLCRLKKYCKISRYAVKQEKAGKNRPPAEIRDEESHRITRLIPKQTYVMVLDQNGEMMDSIGLAQKIQRLQNQGISSLTLIIGGAFGVASSVIQKAHIVLSMSRMTFPHEMALLMVAEQIYRAFSILKGENYHK